MSGSDVVREGVIGRRPGREATTGVNAAGQGPAGRRRGGRGEKPMVPPAEFRSYYGQPVLNPPVWEERDIAGYLFLGGLAGASSLMAAAAALTGRPGLARAGKVGSALAALASTVALVHDLGRPGRFYNMLRTFKVTSPMSVGSWLLGGFVPAAVVAAGSDLTGLLPAVGTAATTGAALLGPGVATYTAVLVSDTAVPAWHDGWREMPFVFATSALTAAAGVGLAGAPLAESGPALALGLVGASAELGMSHLLESRIGLAGEAYRAPEARRMLRAGQVLTVAGLLGGVASRRRSRLGSALAGVALMGASACTRFGIFRAGMASARDPRYTVVPQRRRLGRQASGDGAATDS